MENESEFIEQLLSSKTREKAFIKLLDMYQERLYWHIRKLVGSHENADDVLQNTFVRIYKSLSKFKQQSSLHTWMYRIAYNESLRFIEINKRKYHTSIEDIEQKHLQNTITSLFIDGKEIQVKLKQSLAKLSDKQKTVFQMKYYDDLKFREISEILKVKENTIKTTYYNAVKHLERFLLEEPLSIEK